MFTLAPILNAFKYVRFRLFVMVIACSEQSFVSSKDFIHSKYYGKFLYMLIETAQAMKSLTECQPKVRLKLSHPDHPQNLNVAARRASTHFAQRNPLPKEPSLL